LAIFTIPIAIGICGVLNRHFCQTPVLVAQLRHITNLQQNNLPTKSTMQGRKDIQPKMMYQVNINDLIGEDNFYRQLSTTLDLHFLYKATAKYYGSEGQDSIDLVVFFKICLVGYLNNINSDRRLIAFCSNCLDVRLYIKYNIDEPLPWHSTISRTRQL